ncbi:MAG: ATP synthase F0 subunit B [Desulfuromonadaceae bacterium]|nr:ATP synthase F0 subunit B [Desulfuromonadaceae bacterium]
MKGRFKSNDGGIVTIAATVGFSLVLVGVAYAASDGHGADSGVLLKDFLYRCLNFAIVFGVLAYVLTKPLRKGLGERRAQLIETLEKANNARELAEAKVAEYEHKLAASDHEITELLAQAKEANSQERDNALAEAQAVADTVRKEARQCADREIERARRELRAETAQLAISMAEDRVRQEITNEDHARLVTENLQQMESQS